MLRRNKEKTKEKYKQKKNDVCPQSKHRVKKIIIKDYYLEHTGRTDCPVVRNSLPLCTSEEIKNM